MKAAVITKTIEKVNAQPSEYTLGFRRLISLPQRVRRNINTACVINGESNTLSFQQLLNEMTEKEFINFLKLA